MSYGINDFSEKKPLLNYSDTQERASIFNPNADSSMPPRKKSGKRKSSKKYGKKGGLKGVRVTKGKISLRVAGYSGLQKFGASELVRFVPLSKLRVAAKKVLGRSGAKKTSKKRRKGKRKGRKATF